jgi:(p)ppGpp synthase/HD superfamily hydrolase
LCCDRGVKHMAYSNRFMEAIQMAHQLHRAQTRKGSSTPYITHLLAVAAIVGEHGGNEDEVIVALLHDAPEDQGGLPTLNLIRGQFGEAVAACVAECCDTFESPKPSWDTRKQWFIDRMKHASPSARLVVSADKIHNAESIRRELESSNADVWSKFKGGKEGTLWYYNEVARVIRIGWEHPIVNSLVRSVIQLNHAAEKCAANVT